jgi:phage-related protein
VTVWRLECYVDSRGRNPVEEFIQRLPSGEQAVIRARITFLVEAGSVRENRFPSAWVEDYLNCARSRAALFTALSPGGVIVLLHGFTKKSQKTPDRELQRESNRMKEV